MSLLLLNVVVLVMLVGLVVMLFLLVQLQREFMVEWRKWGLLESHRITRLEERIERLERILVTAKEPDVR